MMRFLILAILAAALSGCPFAGVTQLNHVPESQALREPEAVEAHEPDGGESRDAEDRERGAQVYLVAMDPLAKPCELMPGIGAFRG
jgi:hypothetical protein